MLSNQFTVSKFFAEVVMPTSCFPFSLCFFSCLASPVLDYMSPVKTLFCMAYGSSICWKNYMDNIMCFLGV